MNNDLAAYRFEGFVLDLARGALLTSAGEEVALRPQSFLLLVLFVQNAGRLLDRATINRALWPEIAVSDDSITQCVRDIRRALGDEEQRVLKTVPRRGYMLTAEVSTVWHRPAEKAPPVDKPSIAVLPFLNMSGDAEQDYFADGMVDDIITALSRFKQLFVIARNSSFTYKGKSPDLRQVGRELGVRYVLEGSMRKASNRLRISGQLIDTLTGAHLWADRVEGELENVFDLQDRVTTSIVGTIVQQVDRAEIERVRRRPAANLSAYDCYLRARATAIPSTRENNARALELLARAIELDPAFAPLYGLAAALHAERRSYGWMEDTSNESGEAVETARLAHLAGELGQGDAEVLALACNALAYVVQDLDAGAALIDQATKINPNSWTAWRYSGEIRLWLGEPEIALEHLAHAERLSPVDPSMGELWSLMAHACFMAERYDAAASYAARVSRGLRDFPAGWRISAASAALAGRAEQARLALVRLRELTPGLRVSTLPVFLGPYRRPQCGEVPGGPSPRRAARMSGTRRLTAIRVFRRSHAWRISVGPCAVVRLPVAPDQSCASSLPWPVGAKPTNKNDSTGRSQIRSSSLSGKAIRWHIRRMTAARSSLPVT